MYGAAICWEYTQSWGAKVDGCDSGSCHQGASTGAWENGWDMTDTCTEMEPRAGRQPCGWGGSGACEDYPASPSHLATGPLLPSSPISYMASGKAQGAEMSAALGVRPGPCNCRSLLQAAVAQRNWQGSRGPPWRASEGERTAR